MRLRSKTKTTEPVPVAPSPSLEAVPWEELHGEARRRGFELIPEGVFEEAVGKLEARVRESDAALTRMLAQAEVARRGKVDAGPLLDQLGHLAGVELPRTATLAGDLMRENLTLKQWGDRAEHQAALLAEIAAESLTPDDFNTE